jgi:hypothetical protein
VLKLPTDHFAEYVELTGGHAVSSGKTPSVRRPSVIGRLLFRGFLLAVVAARLQSRARRSGLRIGLRWRLARLALHLHGLGPAAEGVNLGARRRARLDLADPTVRGIVHRYLRSSITALPTGRRPVVEEVSFAFATLNAASALAAMRADAEGRSLSNAVDLTAGLTEAADLGHAEGRLLRNMLGSLAGGLEALHQFAAGGEFSNPWVFPRV